MRLATLGGFILVFTLLGGDARAQDLPSSLRECRLIADPASRVFCYDSITLEGEAASAAIDSSSVFGHRPIEVGVAARDVRVVTEAGTAPRTENPQAATAREFQSTLASIQRLRSGALMAQLSNGEIWVQTSQTQVVFDLTQSRSVTIRRNALGTLYMQVDNAPFGFSVRRFK